MNWTQTTVTIAFFIFLAILSMRPDEREATKRACIEHGGQIVLDSGGNLKDCKK